MGNFRKEFRRTRLCIFIIFSVEVTTFRRDHDFPKVVQVGHKKTYVTLVELGVCHQTGGSHRFTLVAEYWRHT